MNLNSPYMRFLAGCVAVAAAIRLVFVLLMPVLPEIAVVCVAAAIWRLWRYYRDQW